MRTLHWIRSVARVLALVIVVVAVVYLALQTNVARRSIASLIEGAASSPGQTVKLDELSGRLPDAPRVGRVTVSDGKGAWLVIDDVALEWSPLSLLRGRTIIDALTARRVEWIRQPEGPSTSSSSSRGEVPALAVRKVEVAEFVIGPSVAGRAAVFALKGSADLLEPRKRTQLDLSAMEVGGGSARFAFSLDYRPGENRLELASDVVDRAGGTLAALVGLPADAPLAVLLKSEGPLDQWRATLAGSGGSALDLRGAAAIERRGDWRELTLNLSSKVGALGPERLRALYEGDSTIELVAAESGDAWRVDQLKVLSPAITANGTGAFDPAQKRAEGQFTAAIASNAATSTLADGARWRDLTLTARLQGGWPIPTLSIDATAHDFSRGELSAASIKAHVEAQPDRAWHEDDARIAVTARAASNGLRSADGRLNKVLAEGLTLSLQGTLLDRARLTGVTSEFDAAGAVARFAGDASADAVKGVLSLDAPDLVQAGLRSGRVVLQATIDADLAAGELASEGKGTLENVAFDGALDGLLAGEQKLRYAVSGPLRDLRLASFTLEGPHLTFTASGALRADALGIDAHATVPELAVLDAAHGGRGDMVLRIAGTADAPRVEATGSLSAGKLFGRPVETFKVSLSPADGDGRSRFSIEGDYDRKPVEGTANVGWRPEGGATVDDLRLRFASVALSGAVRVAATGLIDGSTRVTIGDVADVGPFIDEDIAGPLSGDIRFVPAGKQQSATLALSAPRFRIDANTMTSVGIEGRIADLLDAPAFALRARAATADLDGFLLEKIEARGDGPLRAMALTVRANQGATVADAKGTLRVAGKPTIIAVDTFQLAREDKTARLVSPIEISIGNHRVLIPAARIASGGGEAVVSGDAGRATALDVTATALPLWVADFIAPQSLPLSGALSGTAKIGKHGATTFDVKVVNFAPSSGPRLVRNLTLTASGKTDRSGADFKLTLADPGRTAFRAAGRVPFAGNGALAVDVDGTADLALANAYLGVTGDRARGSLSVSGKLGGTLAAPRVEGSAKIADGAFRSAESGFEVRNVTAALNGSERGITVTSLTGQAPNGGTISARGDVKLAPGDGYPIDLTLTARRAQLVATTLTTVVADVDAKVSGALTRQTQVSGLAIVDKWDIRLPEKLARPLTPIRVTHRNAPVGLATAIVEEEEAQSVVNIGLDVTVRAPRRVYVRGQGVDAEFGGQVKVTGTTADPIANGRFELRRGAVTALSQRIALTRGDIVFAGEIVPTLDIAGEVRKPDLTATVAVKGKASAPEVTLASTPSLPQDEIIARLLFNKSVQQLSAFEAAQLAATIARWSGLASGPDILESLRNAIGIDALSAVTDSAGGTAVSAGTYVGRGVYVGLVQGTDATAGRATVDIDLNERVKVRGEVGPTGDTRVGVVAEWEY